jgi:hypothetical protein
MHDGAVTVFEAVAALATHTGHSPFLALWSDEFRLPRWVLMLGPFPGSLRSALARSRPSELVQPFVVDPEVVRNLVDHGHGHLVDHVALRLADVEQRAAVDRDGVG